MYYIPPKNRNKVSYWLRYSFVPRLTLYDTNEAPLPHHFSRASMSAASEVQRKNGPDKFLVGCLSTTLSHCPKN